MLNCVNLMGRLTKDPELRYTESNVPVISFTLAVDRSFKKEGQQNVDFINIVAWRKTAEFIDKWFRKGQLVAVTGKLHSRSWKDKDGNNRTVTEVVADEVFFAESKKSTPTVAEERAVSESSEEVNEGFEGKLYARDNEEYADFEELTMADDGELPF